MLLETSHNGNPKKGRVSSFFSKSQQTGILWDAFRFRESALSFNARPKSVPARVGEVKSVFQQIIVRPTLICYSRCFLPYSYFSLT